MPRGMRYMLDGRGEQKWKEQWLRRPLMPHKHALCRCFIGTRRLMKVSWCPPSTSSQADGKTGRTLHFRSRYELMNYLQHTCMRGFM